MTVKILSSFIQKPFFSKIVIQQGKEDRDTIKILQKKVEKIFDQIIFEELWETINKNIKQGKAPVNLKIRDVEVRLVKNCSSFFEKIFDMLFGFENFYQEKMYDELTYPIRYQLQKHIEKDLLPKLNQRFSFMHFTMHGTYLYASYKYG